MSWCGRGQEGVGAVLAIASCGMMMAEEVRSAKQLFERNYTSRERLMRGGGASKEQIEENVLRLIGLRS